MKRFVALPLFAAASLILAACEGAQPPAQGTAGGPDVAPTNPAAQESSGSTLNRQENSGYYPYPGAPTTQVPPSRR